MARLIAWAQENPALVAAIAAAVYYFWPQIKAAFGNASGSKPPNEFWAAVDSARDLIKHLDAAGDTEGADAARKAAARLFEAKPK